MMSRHWKSLSLLGATMLMVAACADEPDVAPDGGPPDAASELDAAIDGGPDAAVDGDGGPDAGSDAGSGDTSKVVFVTSTKTNGDMGGLVGADAECARLAAAQGLEGTFQAWLSTSGTPAASRLTHAEVPYVRTDGTQVAADWNDLVDGTLDAPIDRDENGAPQSGDVWTGTATDGSYADCMACSDCAQWSNGTSSFQSQCGTTAASGPTWTANLVPSCSGSFRLYCLEQ